MFALVNQNRYNYVTYTNDALGLLVSEVHYCPCWTGDRKTITYPAEHTVLTFVYTEHARDVIAVPETWAKYDDLRRFRTLGRYQFRLHHFASVFRKRQDY